MNDSFILYLNFMLSYTFGTELNVRFNSVVNDRVYERFSLGGL